ncbi:MAG: type II/IV secretion system protein [Chthoniobacterales bacterium]|jgi:type IV pilus assembly protein PilB|nr:type II/IV secretion system protein [Chthoniobacterales bacterium]
MDPHLLITTLADAGAIDPAQSGELLESILTSGRAPEDLLINDGHIDEHAFYQTIANSIGANYIDLSDFELETRLRDKIPVGLARLHRALPITEIDGTLYVALTDPLDTEKLSELRFALNQNIAVSVAPVGRVEELIAKYYDSIDFAAEGFSSLTQRELREKLSELSSKAAGNLTDEERAQYVTQIIDNLIDIGIKAKASDIHFEPFETFMDVRMRVDGTLKSLLTQADRKAYRSIKNELISRVKIISNLNIAESRLPQDGRTQRSVLRDGKPFNVDLRVSTLPTQFGESVVLRILDRSAVQLDLDKLGVPERVKKTLREMIQMPNGIIIVTGPTGSGKTTTLYACLREINEPSAKLLTAEDPVEYDIDGIMQVPVSEAIGLDFARCLRAFLRQDPDRILVGETRDLETAQIAIQASLTGHLVFTSLHTNDSTGAITRLIDMGVEPFLISASLELVVAQRLVRRICAKCIEPYEPTEDELMLLGLSAHEVGDKKFYKGGGCEECNSTGYKGRKAIFETLRINDTLREMINQRAPGVVLRQKAIELGMRTLRQEGLDGIFSGETSVEEVLKYT